MKVRIGGRNEKMLIVTDESKQVYLEKLMETKQLMQQFTDSMIEQFDEQALVTSETIKVVADFVPEKGKMLAHDCNH